MVEYTIKMYTDMVLVNGEATGNVRDAQGIYQERYPHRGSIAYPVPKVIERLRERCTFTVNWANCGAPRRRRTINFEEDVLHRVEETVV